jgi:hypothetical protein
MYEILDILKITLTGGGMDIGEQIYIKLRCKLSPIAVAGQSKA